MNFLFAYFHTCDVHVTRDLFTAYKSIFWGLLNYHKMTLKKIHYFYFHQMYILKPVYEINYGKIYSHFDDGVGLCDVSDKRK